MAFYKDLNDDSPTTQSNVIDIAAIAQSLKTLILTRPGERPFLPEYGVGVQDLLFELMDGGAALDLFGLIVDAVRKFETRVELNLSISDVVADPDNNRFNVDLHFSVVGFDSEGLFSVQEFITQG